LYTGENGEKYEPVTMADKALSMSDPAKAKFQSCLEHPDGNPPVHPVKNSILEELQKLGKKGAPICAHPVGSF
jgi:hypothetical protein